MATARAGHVLSGAWGKKIKVFALSIKLAILCIAPTRFFSLQFPLTTPVPNQSATYTARPPRAGFSTPARAETVATPRSILKSTPKLANGHMLATPDSGKRSKRSNSVLGRLGFGSSSSSSSLGKKGGSKSKLDPDSASKKWAKEYGDGLPASDQRTPGGRVRWTNDTPDRTKRDYLLDMAESENPGVLCSVRHPRSPPCCLAARCPPFVGRRVRLFTPQAGVLWSFLL